MSVPESLFRIRRYRSQRAAMNRVQIKDTFNLVQTMFLAAVLLSTTTTAHSQEDDLTAFVEWAKERAIPLSGVESGHGFDDLRPLEPLIGKARVVVLGENAHGVHEFLSFRNRLFEFLVLD